MLNSFPFAIISGTALGFLSGLGVGGGSLLILWLTLVLDMPQEAARTINLLFFLPSGIIATIFRYKQERLPWKKLLPAIISGCLFAALFAFLSGNWDTKLIKKLFGILLLFTGLRELFYKPKKDCPQ